MPFYFDWTYLLVIPGLIIALWAQASVKRAYGKYSQVSTKGGITGADVARRILAQNNIDIAVTRSEGGQLSDHYDPKAKVIRLSQGVYDNSSIAALGIAAHETGHAIQYHKSYMPIFVRNGLLPVANIGSFLAFPMVFLGIIFGHFSFLINIGILLFTAVVIFQIVTLPIEFNASKRAMETLADGGYLDEYEIVGARRVLTAAAMTYVAALIATLLQLLRLILLSQRRR